MQTRPFHVCLVCSSCPSVRDFACSFLQISPHGEHPCCLANGSHYQAHSGLSPPSYCPCRANIKIGGFFPPIFAAAYTTLSRVHSLLVLPSNSILYTTKLLPSTWTSKQQFLQKNFFLLIIPSFEPQNGHCILSLHPIGCTRIFMPKPILIPVYYYTTIAKIMPHFYFVREKE